MNDAPGVGVVDGIQHREHDLEGMLEFKSPVREAGGQIGAFHKFQHQHRTVVRRARDVEDADDIRMLQRSQGLRFGGKAFGEGRVVIRSNLQSDSGPIRGPHRFPHLAEAAAGDKVENFKTGDLRDCRSGIRSENEASCSDTVDPGSVRRGGIGIRISGRGRHGSGKG